MTLQPWARSRSTWMLAAGLVVFAIAVLLSGHEITTIFLKLERIVIEAGVRSDWFFLGVYVLATTLLFPESILAVAAGATFGMARGVTIIALGALIGAAVQYWLARTFLHGPITRWITKRPMFAALTQVLQGRPLRIQLLLRLTPISPAVVSYLLGSAATRFHLFLMACAGLVPHILLEVYVGHVGRHLALASIRSTTAFGGVDVLLVLGLLAALAGMTWVAHIARKAVLAAIPMTPVA